MHDHRTRNKEEGEGEEEEGGKEIEPKDIWALQRSSSSVYIF